MFYNCYKLIFKENNKMRMKLIKGNIDTSNQDFINRYNIKGFTFPSLSLLENTSKLVIDITKLNENILKDYGFLNN